MRSCFKLKRYALSVPLNHFNSRKYCNILNETPRKDWKIDDVTKWAKNYVGDEAIKVLEVQEIDGEALLRISQEALVNAGMKLGPASKILAALKPDTSLDLSTRNLDSLTIDLPVERDKETGLEVFQLRALIDPKDHSSNQLFIRKFYPRYLERVRKYENSIVVGNPGIGKSWFQYYYLVRILNVDKLGELPPDSNNSTAPPRYVIRQVGSRRIETYDIQAKTVVVRRCSELEIEKYLDSFDQKTTLYFFEPDLTTQEPTSTGIPTIITVSPNTLRYHEFLKQKDAIPLYMPVWTEAELVAVGKKLSTLAKEEKNRFQEEEEVKSRYQEFGGIFRSVFGTEAVQKAVRAKRKQAITEFDPKSLLTATTIENMKVSHLLAQFCNIPTEGSDAFESFELDFLSGVEKELRDKIAALDLNELIDILKKNLSPITRYYYELFVARRLVQGVKWQQRNNLSKEYSEFALHLNSSTYFPQFKKMEIDTLYRPSKENYSLVDMVYILEDEKEKKKKLFAIQVSTEKGGKRSIDKTTLILFLNRLKAEDIKEEDFTYYYCPSPHYADFATVTISYPKEWKIMEEKEDGTKESREMTKEEIVEEKNRCKKFLLNCKIIKIPEDYGIQFEEPNTNISKVPSTSLSNTNCE